MTAAPAAVRTAAAPGTGRRDGESGAGQGHSGGGEVIIGVRVPPAAGLAELHAFQGRVHDQHRESACAPGPPQVQAAGGQRMTQPGAVRGMRGGHTSIAAQSFHCGSRHRR